ncbi:MAG: OsmC family protein [Pseudomonadota bacterium]|nr:OsmC family protein [Pseudomonadota bacterium]
MDTAAIETAKMERPMPEPRNGVDTPALLNTINAVGEQPELAKFELRASNRWISGTHSRSKIDDYHGAGGEQGRAAAFSVDADHTVILCGNDNGPTPVEFLLHALAACLTAGIGNIASARSVTLHEVSSTVVGKMDARGILGLSDEVRNGFSSIQVAFRIRGDAPADKLRKIVEQSMARSAVLDVLTKGVPVEVDVKTA